MISESIETMKTIIEGDYDNMMKEAASDAFDALSREIPDTWIIQHESGTIYYEHDTQNCLCSFKVPYSYCPCCGQKMKL